MAGSHVKDFSPEPSTHPLPTLLYMRKYLRYLCRCCFHCCCCCCEGHSVGVSGGTSPHYVPTLPQNTQFGACSENFLISLELHSFNGYSLDGWLAGWLAGQARVRETIRRRVCSRSHKAQLFFAQFIRITILFGRPLVSHRSVASTVGRAGWKG